MINTERILSYDEVLNLIDGGSNHLLIGNGFNRGLGINTSYGAIFEKMLEIKHSVYGDARDLVEECGYDLELFIGRLEAQIDNQNNFLKKFIRNKVKLDFMQATHEIVKSEMKHLYAENNEGIYLLLKNFTNFFTLNYDSLLYQLLLQYKPAGSDQHRAIGLQQSMNFIAYEFNDRTAGIYTEIKTARENGQLEIALNPEGTSARRSLSQLSRVSFISAVKEYAKSKGLNWKEKDIKGVVKVIFEEENRQNVLNRVDDGSRQLSLFEEPNFVFDLNIATQNLFFLHGAFFIYKQGAYHIKITQQTDKALYDKLEEVLNGDEQEIVCVFQNDNKLNAINDDAYLSKCYNKLGEIDGNLVIIGSSLSDNDRHLFDRIEQSNVQNIFISTLQQSKDTIIQQAARYFPSKTVNLFDAGTISYVV